LKVESVRLLFKTPLITKAQKVGTEVAFGSRMLVHQALKQFELWGYTGQPDIDKLEKNLNKFLEIS